MGPLALILEEKIKKHFPVIFFRLENDSHLHAGRGPEAESHFRLFLVSPAFSGLRPVQRSQKVFALLNEEMRGEAKGGLHSLSLQLLTPEEWKARGQNTEVDAPELCQHSPKK